MTILLQDLRFALRQLRKSPGFTIVAILTLALGIGANAIVFCVMNALILRPLNVPQAESLYQLMRGKDKAGNHSFPDYLDLRDRNLTFDDLVAYDGAVAGIDTGGNPSSAWVELVTGNYFDGLRLQPYLGRLFHSSDEHGANSAPYIVLTHAYWHSHFHDDAGVVGRVVQVNKHPFTIVGVAPAEFHGTLVFFSPDFFVPMVNQEQVEGKNNLNERGKRWVFSVMGHLKTGITPAQAIADLNSIGADLEKSYPKDDNDISFTLARPSLYGDYLGRPLREFLIGLMLLAGLILLAACANLGSLFAARVADRSREVALRLALGSSRRRIQHGAVARSQPVAAILQISHPSFCEPRCECLRSSFAGDVSKRIPLWRGPGAADTLHPSIRGHQGRTNRRSWAADYRPRPVAGCANCNLCGAGYFLPGCPAWTRTLAAQQFRF